MSLDAARWDRGSKAGDHNPRQVLEHALRELDAPGEHGEPVHCVVVFGWDATDGGSHARFLSGGSFPAFGVAGLLAWAARKVTGKD